jgi:homospermidine synthase
MAGSFAGKIVVLGCGSVAQCTLPLLVKHLVPAERITIIDSRDNRERIADVLAAGASYVFGEVTKENLDEFLSSHLAAGDVLVDLAWNIDANTILTWAHDKGVLYLNTSVEEWDPYVGGADRPPLERTLYHRHMSMREMKNSWSTKGPTAIVEHGANPGMVSHLAKRALVDIATKVLADGLADDADAVAEALANEDFARLAQALSVKVIHIAERDTQVSDKPKQVDEFVNTWSVEGFYEEGIAPAELGWGTHEKRLPENAYVHTGDGPCNQIALARPGALTWVRSWVPDCEITGMVVRHGEAFTMCDYLTVWDGDTAVYRPTVHYAYCPSDAAVASMHELRMRQFDLQSNQRIMNEEIISGEDRLGVLLMGHPYKAWWTGSLLDIDTARGLIPGQSATTVQVGASVYAAVAWMIENPEEGLLVPDELPWQPLLELIEPYLGQIWSGPADWNPLQSRNELFAGWDGREFDMDDPWQFTNFLV